MYTCTCTYIEVSSIEALYNIHIICTYIEVSGIVQYTYMYTCTCTYIEVSSIEPPVQYTCTCTYNIHVHI